jgi:hypothetical protein
MRANRLGASVSRPGAGRAGHGPGRAGRPGEVQTEYALGWLSWLLLTVLSGRFQVAGATVIDWAGSFADPHPSPVIRGHARQ